jgi:ATP-dependent DNA helicase RecG
MDNLGFNVTNHPQLEALREALVNMLMHADYFSSIKSRVRVFTNRIEFMNAGTFPKPVETLIKEDISLPRNPILAKLFRCIKLAENAGFGFDKMHDNWFAYNHSKPVFRSDLDFVVVEFPTLDEKISHETSTKTSIKTSTKNQEAILKLINEDPRLSAEELGLKLGLSKQGVRYHLDKMKALGLIRYVGSSKAGYWEVLE